MNLRKRCINEIVSRNGHFSVVLHIRDIFKHKWAMKNFRCVILFIFAFLETGSIASHTAIQFHHRLLQQNVCFVVAVVILASEGVR